MTVQLAISGCLLAASIWQPVQDRRRVDEQAVRLNVQRGVRYLKSTQMSDGSWSYPGHTVGMTALAGLALVESEVPRDDKVLVSAFDYVRANAPTTPLTYDISLAILFLAHSGKDSDKELIGDLGGRLVAGQLSSGGWTYLCPLQVPASAKMSNKPPNKTGNRPESARQGGRLKSNAAARAGFGDNSNTQFAVLGVWAAGRSGLDVTESMAEVEKRFRSTQSPQGGWNYAGPAGDSESMTCAGLMALALAKGQKILDGKMTNRAPSRGNSKSDDRAAGVETDPQIEKGLRRVVHYAEGIKPNSSLYFLWSLERVGVALDLENFGKVDWYARGADVLTSTQRPDGSWAGSRGELPDTAFALLFLRRANLTQGMPQLATGRSGSSDNNMRAGNLDDLIKAIREPNSAKDQ